MDPDAPDGARARAGLRLLCRGVVQGVGFRPAVARLAGALGLEGRLANVTAGVRIELAGPRPQLERFLLQLPANLPMAVRLEPLEPEWLTPPLPAAVARGQGIRIAAAPPQPLGVGLVAPSLVADRAPCPACLRELRDPTDPRHRYPFISCCDCGPRYSIANAEPFCRAHTTLDGFPLCPACQAQFDDPGDRRFHAETIGCPACGPQLRLLDGAGRLLAPGSQAGGPAEDPLAAAVALLERGGILALQGVGGFQLLVNAADATAVARLRRRKRRPDKPFALLLDTPARLAGLVEPSPAELTALHDPAAPIVLIPCQQAAAAGALPGVAPGAPALGLMLPASPLHLLLAEAFAGPLVATSGNCSGEPLCTDPSEALDRLKGIAEAFLVHDRPIARPLDDSLLQLIDGRPALLRRARGYAPEALSLPAVMLPAGNAWRQPAADEEVATGWPQDPAQGVTSSPPAPAAGQEQHPILLALGSDLRSAPALAIGDRLWLAPHLGDLADSRCLERCRVGLAELLERQAASRVALAFDAHPGYLSSQLAGALRVRTPRPVLRAVSHHRAHGLAVAAEHGLGLPLPALVLDGLGYGGGPVPLWGCELLWLTPGGARRLASLRPFPLPGGERAVREPRRCALGLLWAAGLLDHPGARALRAAFPADEIRLLQQAMAAGCNSPWCSSAGRLFDALASLLDLLQIASHDAHAGLLLQAAAARQTAPAGGCPLPLSRHAAPHRAGDAAAVDAPGLEGEERGLPRLDWQPLLADLLDAISAGASPEFCAARFHASLAEGLAQTVRALMPAAARPLTPPDRAGARGEPADPAVILAGGCFQNRLLLETLISALRRHGLRPFWGERIPLNDGGLAAGQILALAPLAARPLQHIQAGATEPAGWSSLEGSA